MELEANQSLIYITDTFICKNNLIKLINNILYWIMGILMLIE